MTYHTFRCPCCNQYQPIAGRKMGELDVYICAPCYYEMQDAIHYDDPDE